MANPPLSPITAAPPQRKKGGCGCFGTGCIIVLVLMLIGGGIGFYAGYRLVEYLKSFTSDKGVEIAVVEGTEAEYTAVRQKIEAYEKAYNAGQSSAMQLTAREINILIARDPELKEIRGHAAVSIQDGVVGAQVSLPLDKIDVINSVPQFRGRYFNGDVKLRFTVEDGNARLSMTEARVGDLTAPAEVLKQLSDGWTQQINTDPDFQSGLSRLRKVDSEGDVLIIESKPGPGAVPETSSTPSAVSTPGQNPEAP